MEEKKYKVKNLEGEYAILADVLSGEELYIAMALLPPGTDVGNTLLFKDFDYLIVED